MIINESRQVELYNNLTAIFKDNYSEKLPKLPKLAKGENCVPYYENENIFDLLGYFKCSTPDTVYLCEDTIREYCKKKGLDTDIVSEIVYLHEAAHYIHFHLLGKEIFCKETNPDILRKLFIESFAQLFTHKAILSLPPKYLDVFNIMKEGQSHEYTDYNTVECVGTHPMKHCPKEVLFKTFIEATKINDLNDIHNLYNILRINVVSYFDKENSEWRGDYFKELQELGLATNPEDDPLEFYNNQYEKFIE